MHKKNKEEKLEFLEKFCTASTFKKFHVVFLLNCRQDRVSDNTAEQSKKNCSV